MLSVSDGTAAEFSDMGGAAALLTGLWFGDAGMDSPRRGILFAELPLLAPGIGGRSSGAGDAMSTRSGGGCATIGYACGGRRRGAEPLDSLRVGWWRVVLGGRCESPESQQVEGYAAFRAW